MEKLPNFKEFLTESTVNEAKKYKVADFNEGDIIHFKDGESWIVVKPGMRSSDSRRKENEITAKPFNKAAKLLNVSMSIDMDIDFINDTIKKLEKK